MTDRLALERWIHERDAEAFHALVDRYSDMVYATCRRMLGNPAEAEDVSQECFAALSQTRAAHGEYLGPWLHRVATNLAIKRVRGNVRRTRREATYAENQPMAAASGWDDLAEEVDAAIEALPEELRTLLVAHFLERASQAEIARTLGIPRQTVTNRIRRGVEEVRRILKKKGIVLTAAALLVFLERGTAEAAPVHLVAALGRRAIAGAARTEGGKAAVTGAGSIALPAKWMALATAILLATAALVAAYPSLASYWKDASPSSPAPVTLQAAAPREAPVPSTAPEPAAPPRQMPTTPTANRPQLPGLQQNSQELPEGVVRTRIGVSR